MRKWRLGSIGSLRNVRGQWVIRIAIVAVLLTAVSGLAVWQGWVTLPGTQRQGRAGRNARTAASTSNLASVPVERADLLIKDLQLPGKLTLRTVREVKAPFGEAVATINVAVGDTVQAGDELMTLDRDQLAKDLDSDWLALTNARQALADLVAPKTALEKMGAQTELVAAQEDLSKLEQGPAAADIEAAKLAIQKAQVALQELQKRNDPNSTEVRQARYNLQQAENAVHDAQSAYDAISWRGAAASASQATALQNATVALENVRLQYEQAIAPPDDVEVQSAQLAIDQAQNSYKQLFEVATPAQIAQARLRVAQAQDAIKQLQAGASEQDIQGAEATVLTALTTFEETRANLLSGSAMVAPIDGLVTQVTVVAGQVVERGDTVAVIAALDSFEVNLSVSEEYILRLQEQMPVAIAVDVAPDRTVTGTVTYIARIDTNSFSQGQSTSFASGSTSPGSYPVTIQVNDTPTLATLRAGMNVQVTFIGSNQLPTNSWLVPASSIRRPSPDSNTGTIQVVRGNTPQPVEVTVTNIRQGEWQVVVSPELTARDRVVGAVTTFLGQPSSSGASGLPNSGRGGGFPSGGRGGGLPNGGLRLP